MMMNMLMEMEAIRITGGEKGVHTKDRNDYRSGLDNAVLTKGSGLLI